jgi:hypothetical protein
MWEHLRTREHRQGVTAPGSGARRRAQAWLALACNALSWFVLPAAGAALLAGCGGREERGASLSAGAAAEWSWLGESKGRLDTMRAQLAAQPAIGGLGVNGASGANGLNGAGGTAGTVGEDPGGRPGGDSPSPRERLQRQIDALSRELDRRLVAYINADPPIEGRPLNPRQLAATRMKSDEEMAVAHQLITRSGDYRRAIGVYEAALAADPQDSRLREALARAREERFMSAARFSHAAAGMTAQEVRAVLGQPNTHDIRVYADKGVVGWFYPRDPTGAAAGVWFQQRGGQLTAYLCDWNVLPPATDTPQAPPGGSPRAAPPTPIP